MTLLKQKGSVTKKFKGQYCIIREDLQEQELSIPIWLGEHDNPDFETFIHGTGGFKYRWVGKDEENFQIYYARKWFGAYSIDFEFIN